MLTISDAIARLQAERLPSLQKSLGISVRIVDEEIEEHEWGWVLYCEAEDSGASSAKLGYDYYGAYLIDKVYGIVITANVSGLVFEIARFKELLATKSKLE